MENTLGSRIAQMLDISPQAVSKWENDLTCPDISLLPKLAQILGVSVDTLLSGKTEPIAQIVPVEERKDLKDMMLRIIVDSAEGDKVRVNLPLALVQVALDMGLELPQVSGNSALQNIDLRQIMELVRQGASGNRGDVESADGDIVRIFVE